MPVPPDVVTTTFLAPAELTGVIAVMLVLLITTTLVAAVPPMITAVALMKFVPVMVTGVPPRVVPLVGEIDMTVGGEGGGGGADRLLDLVSALVG